VSYAWAIFVNANSSCIYYFVAAVTGTESSICGHHLPLY